MRPRKLLRKIADNASNVRFGDFVSLVLAFGFRLDRRSGSHHIFKHPRMVDLLNLQERNGEAKPYQVKQFLSLVEEHDLRLEDGE